MEKVIIRDMSEHDLDSVCLLEAICDPVPWSVNALRYELENKESVLKVTLFNNKIIGYACIRTLLDVTHVMKVAVLPEHRGNGVGGILLRDSLNTLHAQQPDVKDVTLEVRESNSAALRLYDNFGFIKTGIRKNYYKNPEENGIIMQLELA